MKLVAPSPAVWQQFCSWFLQPPALFKHGLFVTDDAETTLLGGVRYQDGDEGLVLFSQLTVNQQQPEAARAAAERFLLHAARQYATCRNSVAILLGAQIPGWQPIVGSVLIPVATQLRPAAPAVEPEEPPAAPPASSAPATEELPDDIDDIVQAVRARKAKKPAGG